MDKQDENCVNLDLGNLDHPQPEDNNEPFPNDELVVGKKKDLFTSLKRQFEDGLYANLVVKLGDAEFPCHSEVIRLYSEKFSDLNGIRKIEIDMEKCSYDSFLFIYDWMITSDISSSLEYVTRKNVLDILRAAEYLQINELIEQCMYFIQNENNFNELSACKLFVKAKAEKLNEISDLMLPRIRVVFLLLVSSKDWLNLDVEVVTDLLQSNDIYVNCEIEVFMAAIRWLTYDWTDRRANAYEVLQTIRWKHMTLWELRELHSPRSEFYTETRCDSKITESISAAYDWVVYIYATNPSNPDRPAARNWSGAGAHNHETLTYLGFLTFLTNLMKQYIYNLLEYKTSNDMFEFLKKIIKGKGVLKEQEI